MPSLDWYEAVMPEIRARVEKLLKVIELVRATHQGRPIEDVRRAIAEALDAEGIIVPDGVTEDVARRISEEEKQ
ncbi:hypothetical protein DP939_09385 [Spongiactinospora rosea]|uniref:Uncharacterized protein n=1 Tax=Spongiactinospora rosea TaxID=2248750 RepID=A0A366M376_9ACTN|nr:hypothetical protein [Spongiactinospora rosea]RBQ20034.1 hypothetical protein DP939_09385 [Spongiactinospora rosea]